MVTIQNLAFNPSTIQVKPGTKVTWVNHDQVTHNISFKSGPRITSSSLHNNQSFSYTFQIPGTFTYTCTTHPSMHGTVIVANA